MKKGLFIVFFVGIGLCLPFCSKTDPLHVERQITCVHTNTYLLYSEKTRDAALIDVAGPVDSLLAIIDEQGLHVRYFLFTHEHYDHVMGLPGIRDQFPQTRVCISKQAFEDMQIQKAWGVENLGTEWVASMEADPVTKAMLNFDPTAFSQPDIYLSDGLQLPLGAHKVRVIFTPGHSRGHVCFAVDEMLFSGDVLFYRSVGHTGFLGGSQEDLIRSVRNLYKSFPDETQVYPGHGPYTDIGSERNYNEVIRDSAIHE